MDQGYKAENVDTYELGVKSEWLDRSLLLNAAVFCNDYTDQQVGIQRIDPSGQTLSAITNAGVVEIKGFELEATWRATEHVTSGGYAFTRRAVRRVRDRRGGDRAAARRGRQPDRRLLPVATCRRRRSTR